MGCDIKPKSYFNNDSGWIDFENDTGVLSAQTKSESCAVCLTAEETKRLFVSMMYYYKANDDVFWEKELEIDIEDGYYNADVPI